MSWFYAIGEEQKGPVDAAALKGLREAGQINDDSLVWQEGMAEWLPYQSVRDQVESGGGASEPGPVAEAAAAVTAAVKAADVATCAYSGKQMPRSEMVKYGDAYVAPEHKDAFVQRLQEGGAATGAAGGLEYGGFWVRFLAKIIDGFATGLVFGAPYILAYVRFITVSMKQPEPDPAELASAGLWMGLGWLLMVGGMIFYTTWMVGKFGATLGKMALGLRVVNPDGSKVTYMKAFGRYWGEVVTNFTFYIGYIIAAFDDEKRALHDMICSTRVIVKR